MNTTTGHRPGDRRYPDPVRRYATAAPAIAVVAFVLATVADAQGVANFEQHATLELTEISGAVEPRVATGRTTATSDAALHSRPILANPKITGIENIDTADQFDLSGNWYEPATAGQGLMLELYTGDARGPGSPPYFFAGWFTYTDRAGGTEEQDWFTLESLSPGSTPRQFNLLIAKPNPGRFESGPITFPVQVGTASIEFQSCTQATLDYTFDAAHGGRSGRIELQRLLADVSCEDGPPLADAPRSFLNSGAWFRAELPGQGLFFEINGAQDFLFGASYTYTAVDPADYRWFTLQKPGIGAGTPGFDEVPVEFGDIPIYQSTGGRFDRAGDIQTREVGRAWLRFTSCTQAVFQYQFDRGELVGRSGQIALTRVGPAPSECAP